MDLLPRRPSRSGAPVALPPVLDRASEYWWSRSPRTRAIVVAILCVVALALVGRGATRSPWGPPTPVLVAGADLGPGGAVRATDVEVTTWPAALVPADAFTDPSQLPPDARVRGDAPAGTALTRRHLASGIDGLLRPGEAGIALPRDGLPDVQPGQQVDVVASSPHGGGVHLARSARVVSVDGDWIWVAAPEDRVDAVAGSDGRVGLAVRPPS